MTLKSFVNAPDVPIRDVIAKVNRPRTVGDSARGDWTMIAAGWMKLIDLGNAGRLLDRG
jgi:hypothetical protein